MALLDTLKSTAGAITKGVLGPIGGSIVNAGTKALSSLANTQAKSAASLSTSTPTTASTSKPLTYQGEPTSSYATGKPIGQTPVSNISGGITTKSGAASTITPTTTISAPKPAPVAPAPVAPQPSTQISGSNPFGNSSYTPMFSSPASSTSTINNTMPRVAPGTVIAPPPTGYVNAPPPSQASQASQSSSEADMRLKALQQALLGTYQQTPEERRAQEALQRLSEQQAQLSGAFRSGTNKIGEQPIVLGLLRGQQQALQKQYEGEVGALADQAKPLEVQLANLLASREQQNKALSTEYGFASEEQKRQDAIAAAQASGNKPIEVGGSLIQLNPETGQYEVIYQAPDKDAGGFTLSEGQKRYDANGNLIAGSDKFESGGGGKIVNVNGTDYFQDAFGNLSLPNLPSNPADQQKVSALQDKVGLIDSLLNSKGLAGSVGPYAISRLTPFTIDKSERAEFAAGINQLINKETIDTLVNLKQQGGTLGALSDQERVMLQSATSKIGSWMKRDSNGNPTGAFEVSEEAFKKELNEIKRLTQKAIANASGGAQSSQITTQSLVQKGVRQDLVDQLTAMGKTPQEIAQIAGISFNNAPSKALNGSLGSLSAKYESGGNPGAIGYDSTGGYSYGTYQLAHNNAQRFVSQSPYASQFAGIPFNSAQFQQKWKEIAQKDPQGFAKAQHDYIAKTHYEPVINRITSMGVNPNSLSQTAKDVIWSTAVQHGPSNKIIEQALSTAINEADFIKKVYQLRWNNGSGFASSTPAVQKSVYNRFFGPNGELATALSRLS